MKKKNYGVYLERDKADKIEGLSSYLRGLMDNDLRVEKRENYAEFNGELRIEKTGDGYVITCPEKILVGPLAENKIKIWNKPLQR